MSAILWNCTRCGNKQASPSVACHRCLLLEAYELCVKPVADAYVTHGQKYWSLRDRILDALEGFCGCGDAFEAGRCVNEHCLRSKRADAVAACRTTAGPCTCGVHRTELGDWHASPEAPESTRREK